MALLNCKAMTTNDECVYVRMSGKSQARLCYNMFLFQCVDKSKRSAVCVMENHTKCYKN